VCVAELGEFVLAGLCQGQAHDAAVLRVVAAALNQPKLLGAVDELDRAVMSGAEVVGDFSDVGPVRSGVSLDREQELVLGGGEPHRGGLFAAPSEELTKSDPEGEQPAVVQISSPRPSARLCDGVSPAKSLHHVEKVVADMTTESMSMHPDIAELRQVRRGRGDEVCAGD
jgi:hypothetical protein